MQYELIRDKHCEWLKNKLNTTFEEIDNMSEDEEDEFLTQLAFVEADEVCDETEYIDIMGIEVPQYTIPVNPGRNLAVILEIAAMNHRQKKMGYNTGAELERKLMESFGLDENGNEIVPRQE